MTDCSSIEEWSLLYCVDRYSEGFPSAFGALESLRNLIVALRKASIKSFASKGLEN